MTGGFPWAGSGTAAESSIGEGRPPGKREACGATPVKDIGLVRTHSRPGALGTASTQSLALTIGCSLTHGGSRLQPDAVFSRSSFALE
jgi:hypothetical protein